MAYKYKKTMNTLKNQDLHDFQINKTY